MKKLDKISESVSKTSGLVVKRYQCGKYDIKCTRFENDRECKITAPGAEDCYPTLVCDDKTDGYYTTKGMGSIAQLKHVVNDVPEMLEIFDHVKENFDEMI